MNKQNTIKVTKENIIKTIAKQSGNSLPEIKEFYNILEDTIFNLLSTVNEEQDICIKLFEGMSLSGEFIPEKKKENNLTKKVCVVSSKIKPKFNITRSYREKLNDK